ncbi:MAG: threonine/serine exporter family protein [Clostridiales bacterium]|nr:threonine/serine exporter family protein [Clostridiales bacterium]
MVNVFQKKVLILAIYAGEIMMKNGAEIYRVEDTITRICKACGINYIEVFATPTGIFVSLDKGGEENDTQTYIKRIKSTNTDLNKISMINRFSREFTTTDLSVEDGMKMLKEIDGQKPYPLPVRLLGAAMVSSFFCLIFGGTVVDFCVAFLAGVICYLLSAFLTKYEINFFIRGFCCCALASFIAMTAATSITFASYEPIIIGSIMIFVPGVAITNSIRDFLSGDMLSGVARMTEALLTAVSLAAGAGVIIKLWGVIGGVPI